MALEQVLDTLDIFTKGEGFIDLTKRLNTWVKESHIKQGVVHITLLHTSCSLTINENADPRVLNDLTCYMKAIVPETEVTSLDRKGSQIKYLHQDEGADDMPAHIKTALTCTSLSLSINSKKLVLGTWQAVYLWEHRYSAHQRRLSLHAIGEIE